MTTTKYRRSPLKCALNASVLLFFAFCVGGVYAELAVLTSGRSAGPGQGGLVWYERGVGVVACGLAVAGLVSGRRWLVARRQQRDLADPGRAASVPPLGEHAVTTRERSRRRRAAVSGTVTALVAGALTAGGLALRSAAVAVFMAALCLVSAVMAGRNLASWRRIRYVDRRLSQPIVGSPVPPMAAAPRAPAKPSLTVTFWPPSPAAYPSVGVLLRDLPRAVRPGLRMLSQELDVLSGIRELTAERNFAGRRPLQIGYFRLFDNDPGIDPVWSKYGYVHLLRSPASVSRAEMLQMKNAPDAETVFVSSAERLLRDLSWQPAGPVYAYPVRALLCHSEFWKTAVDLLLPRLDLVIMRLSGYHHGLHEGTGYELQRSIDRVPVHRVVLLADPAADRPYLEAQVRHAWSGMADASPNAGDGFRTVLVARMGDRSRPVMTHALFRHVYERLDREEPRCPANG